LFRDGYPNYIFAFHDSDEIGPKMLARVAKHTGLTPDDLDFSFIILFSGIISLCFKGF